MYGTTTTNLSNRATRRVSRGRTSLAIALCLGVAAVGIFRTADASTGQAPIEWLEALDAPNRMLFDTPASGGGVPLIHALNYMNSWNAAGAGDAQIDAVVALYGATTFHGLSDAAWAKYSLGEMMGEVDAAGAPAVANPWRVAPTFDGATVPPASIEALSGRGATFIMCNNALTYFAGKVAAAHGLEADAVYADLKANILPEVTLVPAMVVAIDRAQQAGVSYHRQ